MNILENIFTEKKYYYCFSNVRNGVGMARREGDKIIGSLKYVVENGHTSTTKLYRLRKLMALTIKFQTGLMNNMP